MNIVYVLQNQTNGMCYIGSKSECEIVGGVIFSLRHTGERYYGSSSSPEMKAGLVSGDEFVATVLEVVGDNSAKMLKDAEAKWLVEMQVDTSPRFYNLTTNTLSPRAQVAVLNKYGETQLEVASSRSSISKRYAAGLSVGFENPYDLYSMILNRLALGESGASISRSFGKHRHWAKSLVRGISIDDINFDRSSVDLAVVENMVSLGATLEKISDMVKVPTICLIKILHGYKVKNQRIHTVCRKLRKTEEELGYELTEIYLSGSSILGASKELGIHQQTTNYFIRKYLRKRLHTNDM